MDPHAFGGLFLILTALAGAEKPVSRVPPLGCRLEADRTHAAGAPVRVTFFLRNRSARAVSILDWQTPLEGLLGDIFQILPATGGEPLPYQGPMVKRRAPQSDEYVRISPKGEVSGSVDAAAAYDLTRPGRYTITFRGTLLDVVSGAAPRRAGRELRPATVSCNSLSIEITGR
ncbi:MAG: protease [Thermoanaerobaculia bacterium]